MVIKGDLFNHLMCSKGSKAQLMI